MPKLAGKVLRPSKVIEHIENQEQGKEFIPTGFPTVDEFLDGGFAKREMVVIGGASGVGKSFLGCQLMLNAASSGFKTLYLSLEIGAQTIVSRMMGSLTNIKPFRFIAGMLDLDEHKERKRAKAKLISLDEYISIADQIYVLDKILEAIKSDDYDFVIVDFIQNVMVPKANSSYEGLSEASLKFQKVAKSQGCGVVVFSQLSNRVAASDGEHELLEYKGSGTIAQVADLGFWLIDKGAGEEKDLRLALRKNRRGPGWKEFRLEMHTPGGLVTERV